MNRFFNVIVFYCLSIAICTYAMNPSDATLPLKEAHVPRPDVPTLQEIVINSLAKEKVHSYLSRPTCSELSKTDDILQFWLPEDLLTEVTSTQQKNISLADLALSRDVVSLVECSDPTQVAMASSCGSAIGVDVVTEEIHYKTISFENYHNATTEPMYGNTFYVGTALSSGGRVWGAVSPEHNDRLLIGGIADLFDPEVGSRAQIYNQISVAQDLDVHYGTLRKLALKSDGSQCVAVWEPLSARLVETQKLLFYHKERDVQETVEISRVNTLAYAHHEPLLVVSHESGTISLWDTQKATCSGEINIFESAELVFAIGFSYDDSIIYLGTCGGDVAVFNKHTGQCKKRFDVHNDAIRIVQSHPQGLCVATAADDGNVTLWNKDITKKLATVPYHATALNFSHDGTFLYVVTKDKQFHRIPLGNPWELVCHRAWLACKNDQSQREEFKNWGIYKKVMSQEQKDKGILGEQLRQYLATDDGQ